MCKLVWVVHVEQDACSFCVLVPPSAVLASSAVGFFGTFVARLCYFRNLRSMFVFTCLNCQCTIVVHCVVQRVLSTTPNFWQDLCKAVLTRWGCAAWGDFFWQLLGRYEVGRQPTLPVAGC